MPKRDVIVRRGDEYPIMRNKNGTIARWLTKARTKARKAAKKLAKANRKTKTAGRS